MTIAVACTTSKSQPAEYSLPSQILNLTDWKITLPVEDGDAGKPIEIMQPALADYQSEYFKANKQDSSVVFRANVGGIPQPGSDYARSELREMTDGGANEAAWSSRDERHSMSIREAITRLPAGRPSLVAGQIHDDDEYVVLIRLDGSRLYAKADDQEIGVLDRHYELGSIFTVRLEAEGQDIKIFYNDELKVDYQKSCSNCYFKAGAYLQTNTELGDKKQDYGEVKIYDLRVEH